MNIRPYPMLVASMLAAAPLLVGAAAPSQNQQSEAMKPKQPVAAAADMKVDKAQVEQILAAWPERPRLGAVMMMAKYGPPQEATTERIIWHDQGPFKRITVTKKEDAHDFPKPHMDFLEHTINYQVPARAADALMAYDGSCTVDRTRGEMSARCDLEGHNILTLNLANDILTEKVTWQEAREQFSTIVVDDTLGKNPAYVTKLQFEPSTEPAAYADKPTIPGSPVRPGEGEAQPAAAGGATSPGEILGFVVAVDENEIIAAMVADKKNIRPEVKEYAKMLHTEHGKNAVDTMKLGEKISAAPTETPAVDALRVKGAGELAAITLLDGPEFEKGYLDMMVKGHTEALELIDTKLLTAASNEELKQHLTMTREHIAMHLEKAKELQGSMK